MCGVMCCFVVVKVNNCDGGWGEGAGGGAGRGVMREGNSGGVEWLASEKEEEGGVYREWKHSRVGGVFKWNSQGQWHGQGEREKGIRD